MITSHRKQVERLIEDFEMLLLINLQLCELLSENEMV